MTEDSAKAKQTAKLTTPTGLGENARKDISESPERRPMTPRPSMRQWKPRVRVAGSRPATSVSCPRGCSHIRKGLLTVQRRRRLRFYLILVAQIVLGAALGLALNAYYHDGSGFGSWRISPNRPPNCSLAPRQDALGQRHRIPLAQTTMRTGTDPLPPVRRLQVWLNATRGAFR